ncbi:DUF998 domain-containing protein [uncultured Roseobacter sp.]|uniref:DUF998 domain-containing protein n=1 Tax=uncultured Roseobacter sp. TaxID=114847 RepID=UPI00261EB8D0|nr:DUF998 domain-containing protein [uncultured Roseobacter sp.]
MTRKIDTPNSMLLLGSAWLAIAGALALVLGNLIGSIVVPGHDWIANTVSDLAAGKYEIIQDIALYGFAGSLIACAIAAANLHLDGTRWNIGITCLTLLAMCVVVIGARNEYGDNDNEGIVIHIYVVYVLGALFALLFLAMARGLSSIARRYGVISYGCAALWVIGAPIFFFMPTEYDGAYERGLGLIAVVWVVSYSLMLLSVSKETRYPETPQ